MSLTTSVQVVRLGFSVGLVVTCIACAPYDIKGNFTSSPPFLDKGVPSKINEVVGTRQIELLLSTDIKDAEQQVPPTKYTQAVRGKFYINPVRALRLTISNINLRSQCKDNVNSPCEEELRLHISQFSIQAASYAESGFRGTDVFVRSVGYVEGDKHEGKVCLTEGIGPSRFWYSASTLNTSFQYAAHEAFAKAIICLISPDSIYNKPRLDQYLFGVSSEEMDDDL